MREILVVVLLCAAAGCSANLEDKLGDEGELCTSDNDCRFEFVCDQSLCISPEDINPDPTPASNPDPPNPEPGIEPDPEPDFVEPEPPRPNPPIEDICSEICERLEDCGFSDGNNRECEIGCSSDLRGREDEALCMLELDCDDLPRAGELCFDGDFNNNNGGGETIERCFTACDRLSNCDEFSDRCGDRLAEEVIDACFDLCDDDPNLRSQIAQVADLPCDTLVEVFIDGFELNRECD